MESLAMMGGTSLADGYKAGMEAQCMNQQAVYLATVAKEYQQQWSKAMEEEGEIGEAIQAAMLANINIMGETKARFLIAKEMYTSHIKNIEISGILFVMAIFFLLLLKTFGVLSIIGELLAWPFKGLFSKKEKTTTGTTTKGKIAK